MKWLKEGERKTKFFHALVKELRSSLKVRSIKNDQGDNLEQQDKITIVTIEFYER